MYVRFLQVRTLYVAWLCVQPTHSTRGTSGMGGTMYSSAATSVRRVVKTGTHPRCTLRICYISRTCQRRMIPAQCRSDGATRCNVHWYCFRISAQYARDVISRVSRMIRMRVRQNIRVVCGWGWVAFRAMSHRVCSSTTICAEMNT